MKIDITKSVNSYVKRLTENFTKELTKEIVMNTPVFSGSLASKWSIGYNKEAPSVPEKIYNQGNTTEAANENAVKTDQINRLSNESKGVNIGEEINIGNDSDHAVDIEFNTPNAPKTGGQRHMLRRAEANAANILKRAEKLTKDIEIESS